MRRTSDQKPLLRHWSTAPTNPSLRAEEVHVWRASMDVSNSKVEELRKLLTNEEVIKGNRLQFEADRRKFIVARSYLRKLLGQYLCVHPASITFSYNKYGKPSLAKSIDVQNLSFSVAHSGELALYAVTLNRKIGVDLEKIQPEFNSYEIASSYFSASEVKRLDDVPGSLRQQAFFNCWTLKEAFVKAIGLGLSLPLDRFEVAFSPDEPARLLQTHWDEKEASRWSLMTLEVEPGYVAALAVKGHNWELCTWDFEEDGRNYPD